MEACFQFRTQNVLEHGRSVWKYFEELHSFLLLAPSSKEETLSLDSERWKLPDWALLYKREILESLESLDVLKTYLTYHDCGKPFCRVVDDQGKQHFPDHARVSHMVWSSLLSTNSSLDTETNRKVAFFILHDMDVHLLKADGLSAFCALGKTAAVSLLLSGLAELHSNAQMFGGLNSDSFRIKWKQIDKRGRQVCKLLFPEATSIPSNICE